jgi:hypothetical protein
MNKYLLGAAAVLAVAVPGVASAASGYVGVDYANTHVDGLGSDHAWGGEGAVAFDSGSGITFELDATVLDADSDTATDLAGHIYTRNDSYLFGAFVGMSNSDSDTAWTGGLEANKFWSNFTLAGSVQYANDDDADASAWGVNVQGRYFATENFRLQAGLGWDHIDFGGAGDDSALTLGVGGEYQFSSAPVSLGLSYAHTSLDDADLDANTWTVSLRYNFGGGTLLDRDRHGASQADLVGIGALSL